MTRIDTEVRSGTPDLEAAILAFDRAARWASGLTRSLAEDPFRIDLPPLEPGGGGIDAVTMELLGGLYLVAELEETGLLRVAELVITDRMSLDLRSTAAAEVLEEAAREARQWYAAETRAQLYARVFGLGAAASAGNSNDQFLGLLLDLCSAINELSPGRRFPQPAGVRFARVRQVAASLRANLASRQHGNTRAAARRIAGQVRTSVEVLSHPGVMELVAGRTMWDVVRAVLGEDAPDVNRHVTSGRAGQQLLGWAGSPAAAAGEPTSATVDAAALWLAARGFDLEDAA